MPEPTSDQYLVTATGVRVFKDWKGNIVVDPDNHVLAWKASLARETCQRGDAKGKAPAEPWLLLQQRDVRSAAKRECRGQAGQARAHDDDLRFG